ncbi:hypothetical protein niasHT_023403 [Heterodera trifolii]|uniref:Uncharacterized protein n=1 Tax=Heterodera trifolii TaxID=157864 RepID=A0ABD2K463_9BILA
MSPSISEIINRRNELERLYNGAKQEPIWLCFVSSTGEEKQKQTIDNFLFYLEDYIGYAISNPPTVKEEKKLSKQAQILYFAFFDCEETIAWKYFKAYATTSPTVQQFLDELSSFFALALDLSPEHSQLMSSADFSQALLNVTESVPEVLTVHKQSTSAASDPRPLPVVTEPVLEESTYNKPWDLLHPKLSKMVADLKSHQSTNVLPTVPSTSAASDPRPLPVVTASATVPREVLVFNSGSERRDSTSRISKFRKFVATLKKKNRK